MTKSTAKCLWLILLCFVRYGQSATGFPASRPALSPIVRIHATVQRANYSLPWQTRRPASQSGSGFVVSRKRILTNAHLVADAKFIEVQMEGDPRRFRARVTHIAHDSDMAVLAVDDNAFFRGIRPMKLASTLPRLNDEVTVLGYPIGGQHLAITKGVVSRLDYATYVYSGVDQHLVLQVDAAINPGNSGGPIMFKGKVVGLAFQAHSWAENISYGIPLPVIRHVLQDMEDGIYDGYPELGVAFMALRNPEFRHSFGLPDHKTGIVVYYIDPFGSAKGSLNTGDVLLAVDDHAIANDGMIVLDGRRVRFEELIERKQREETVHFDIWREGRQASIEIPLATPLDPYLYRNVYDRRPEYFISGGLVFSPLNRETLRSLERKSLNRTSHQIIYAFEYAKIDGLHENRDEFVVLTHRLPHTVNTYLDDFVNRIVDKVNGVPVRNLLDIKKAMVTPIDGFHVIRFMDVADTLVLDAAMAKTADAQIADQYRIRELEYFGRKPEPVDARHETHPDTEQE